MPARQSSAPPQGRAPRAAQRAQTRPFRSETTLCCRSLTVAVNTANRLRPAHMYWVTVCLSL